MREKQDSKMDDNENLPQGEDEELLQEIRDYYRYFKTYWEEVRNERQVDLRYLCGDPWEPEDRKARKDAGRPCINHDELNQYVNQAVNSMRQNRRGIKIEPRGNGATDKTAELHQDIARTIEYRSKAQSAYLRACLLYTSGAYAKADGTGCGTPSGGGAVSSVFTRTGAVTAQSGDYTATQVGLGNVTNDVQTKNSLIPNSFAGFRFGNSGSADTAGTAANVVSLFSTCSGTQYLGADGACHNSSSLSLGNAIGGSPTANAILYGDGSGNLQNAAGITRTGSAQLTLGVSGSPGNEIVLGTTATDSASLGTELTTSGTCSGTGWTGTYPNYVAPGTTAPLTCTGFTSGSLYQTVTSIGAGGSGSVTIAIGTAQVASGSSGTVTAGLKANGTSLTYLSLIHI